MKKNFKNIINLRQTSFYDFPLKPNTLVLFRTYILESVLIKILFILNHLNLRMDLRKIEEIENEKVSIRAKCDFKYVNIVFYFKN